MDNIPTLIVYIETPEPHIQVLWGVQYVMPYLICPTPKDDKLLAFSRYIRFRKLPDTMEIPPKWMELNYRGVLDT